MAIYHIGCHGLKRAPSNKEIANRIAMLEAEFATKPFIESWIAGRYFGNPQDGYHDAACLKFKNIEAYRTHMLDPHGQGDEATMLRKMVARVKAFDIITPDEPGDTEEKIIELYKARWELFPEVAKALREDVAASFPFL
ncbi:MAG: hypothetical protein KJP07_13220 [Desulfatitalea sp.]|nr:hypothetical protein [Desulfatitalea sp.]